MWVYNFQLPSVVNRETCGNQICCVPNIFLIATSGKLPYRRRMRQSTNTREPYLDWSHVFGILIVHMSECGFSPFSFLLVFFIMISYIPTWTRLIFYKAIINIFTDGLEPKDISKFCYLDHGTHTNKALGYLLIPSPFWERAFTRNIIYYKKYCLWNMIDLVAAHFPRIIEGTWKLHTYISTGNLALQLGIKYTS